MTDIEALTKFKTQMRRLARLNDDEFKVDVKIDEKGWHVTVTETADNHVFLSASSDQALWMAIDKAESEIPAALKAWGYRDES